MTDSPFANFACDQCGACCQALIVEADEIDVRREPKLLEYLVGDRDRLRQGLVSITLFSAETKSCPFLCGGRCSIYQTRPLECVAVEPGDAKCQQARWVKKLPMLADRDGNPPSEELLRCSADHYGLDYDEWFGEGVEWGQAERWPWSGLSRGGFLNAATVAGRALPGVRR